VLTYLDVPGVTNQVVDALAERGLTPLLATQLRTLSGPIASGVEGFTHDQVVRVVQSDAFADAWTQANRVAHDELVKALTGEGGGAVTVEGDTVSLDLAPIIAVVKQRLVDSGFTLAERIPQVDKSFVLFQSEDITRARSAFNLLNTLGNWLPVVALVLLAIGIYLAKDHRRAPVGAGVGLAGAIGWGADRAGLPTGRFGVWVEANKRALQVGAVILACLALVFWSQPTGKVVLGLTLALLVVLALIEFLGRRPADAPVEAQAPVE
jgi:hypothetical protein